MSYLGSQHDQERNELLLSSEETSSTFFLVRLQINKSSSLGKKINILGNYASTSNLLITELKEQLKANTRTLINFRDSLRKLIEFQNSLGATHNIINQLGSIRALINLIEQTVQNIHQIHQLVINSLQLAKNKITNSQLFSPIFLLPFVLEMNKETKLHTVIPLETKTYQTFLTYSWTIQSATSPYELITLIPFISIEKFVSYKLIPFPTHLPLNKSLVRVMYNDINSYFFVNYGNRKYTYLKESAHDLCRHLGQLAVCPQSQVVASIDDQSCLLALILNFTNDFSHCPIAEYKPVEPYTVTLGHFTLISFSEKTRASIACEKPNSIQHVYDYVFTIPHGCMELGF